MTLLNVCDTESASFPFCNSPTPLETRQHNKITEQIKTTWFLFRGERALIFQRSLANYRKGNKPKFLFYIPVGNWLLLWLPFPQPYHSMRWNDGWIYRAGIPTVSLLDAETVLINIMPFCSTSKSIIAGEVFSMHQTKLWSSYAHSFPHRFDTWLFFDAVS